jgi:hypothetical protein
LKTQEAAVGAVHSAPGFRPKIAVAQSICHLSLVAGVRPRQHSAIDFAWSVI